MVVRGKLAITMHCSIIAPQKLVVPETPDVIDLMSIISDIPVSMRNVSQYFLAPLVQSFNLHN